MNLSVFLATVACAVVCGGIPLLIDAVRRKRIERLRAEGTESDATVRAYAVQHQKPVLICRLPDGTETAIVLYTDNKYRKGDSVRVRSIVDGARVTAELVDQPMRSIGRGVGLSVGIGILLLGIVLAALS